MRTGLDEAAERHLASLTRGELSGLERSDDYGEAGERTELRQGLAGCYPAVPRLTLAKSSFFPLVQAVLPCVSVDSI